MTIPSQVTYGGKTYKVDAIGQFAFAMSPVTNVSIPNSVKHIKYGAFHSASSLTQLTIPATVTAIGDDAFANCGSLQYLTCLAGIPPTMASSGVFDANTYASARLIVPKGSKNGYRVANWWKNFATMLETGSLTGDTNGDGEINIADVNSLIDVILGTPVAPATVGLLLHI